MSLPWPTFSTWHRIAEEDRAAVGSVITQLLAHGALLGEEGRNRELYLLAREYQTEIAEYLAPLNIELVAEPDKPIFHARPIPADCGLMARFNKAETLLVLTLWRMFHDARMASVAETVIVTANDVWQRLKLYFETIAPPTESHLREMLNRLRGRRLVRIQSPEDPSRFGDTQIEILPTLPRVIPFEDAPAWEEQAALYRQPGEEIPEQESV